MWDMFPPTSNICHRRPRGGITTVRIYVGSLPYRATEQDLADLFGQIGQVLSATVIIDRDTGRSKCFGFVEMSNDQEARTAIEIGITKKCRGDHVLAQSARYAVALSLSPCHP